MTLWISPHIWDSLTRLEYQKKTETRLSRSYENNVAMRLCTGCSATVPASVWEMNGKQLHFPLHQHEMPKAKDITGGTIYKKKKWGKWLGVRRKERGVGRRRGREREKLGGDRWSVWAQVCGTDRLKKEANALLLCKWQGWDPKLWVEEHK